MSLLDTMTHEIVDACLPGVLINDDDRALIAEYRELLLGIEDDLIAMFFSAIVANDRTAEIVRSADPQRLESELRGWWQETVTGDLGTSYLQRMALVGIVHVRHGVTNSMTLTMLQLIRDRFSLLVMPQITAPEAIALGLAFSHIQVTVGSVIAEANTRAHGAALEGLAGLRPELTERMLAMEVTTMVDKARDSLQEAR